mgnify:CR=1 FL=1
MTCRAKEAASGSSQQQQSKELAVFAVLYGLSNLNATMLSRAVGTDAQLKAAPSPVADSTDLIRDHHHPLMLALSAVWLIGLDVAIGRQRTQPVRSSTPQDCGSARSCCWSC